MTIRTSLAALAAFGLLAASHAQISAFTYRPTETDPAVNNSYVGKINQVDAAYNASTKVLDWSANLGAQPAHPANAFWLVLSGGPDPMTAPSGTYAIFFFDATRAGAPVLTAYPYNNALGPASFNQGPGSQLLFPTPPPGQSQYVLSALVSPQADGSRTFSFSVDTTGIQSRLGPQGASFGDKIGIWFHPLAGAVTQYDAPYGHLSSLTYTAEGWFDAEDKGTTPEPATFAVLGLGALALARRKRAAR